QIMGILGAEAVGITLIGNNDRSLELRFSQGLDDPVMRAVAEVSLDSNSLLAHAVKSGDVQIVDDLKNDGRIAMDAVRASRFGGCLVVPLRARAGDGNIGLGGSGKRSDVLGAAFVFLARGRKPTDDDRELMVSIGTLLGNAVEKASLLEAEKSAVKKLVALDEIAVALASTLDVNEVALTVARSVHRLFGASRILIARLDVAGLDGGFFVPLHVLDEGEPVTSSPPIPVDDTIMGLALSERTPVQRVRPPSGSGDVSIDPFTGKPVQLLPYEAALFSQGVGTGVAVPVIQDGEPVGAMWLGYAEAKPLLYQDLTVLQSIGMHVAVATKNAALFAARNEALEAVHAAQAKLVESEKLNAIGLIAHGVAHDFNNILGSILGRAQLLKAQLRDPAHVKHADIIEKAAIDGAETVRRIQEIGRQDKIDDFIAVDLGDIVQDVVDLTQERWRSRAIAVHIERTDDSAVVAGNPHQLREVLVNLVHNAVDAMPSGGELTLSTRADADTCEVRVRDTGAGMPQEIIGRIFDPYFTTKGERGTGLGLSVSLSIVRRHSGDVDVVSETEGDKRGTTFILTFPRFVRPAPQAEAPVEAHKARSKARVLVVDDEQNIR
ncbi:MAG TPA: ATP-binding protein, partial [Myxococcota bacterium]